MLDTLSHIAKKFREERVVWGVGASLLLHHYGLVDRPNDIDILVDLSSIEKADTILNSIGEKKRSEEADTYATKYFYEYMVNGFDVDVMAGLRIHHSNGIFDYVFDESSVSGMKTVNGVEIPLTSLEDWYVLYQLIPNREMKVNIIEEYLLSKGIERPDLLERALTLSLPDKVRKNIKRILKA